jgi:hypothetical protein
MEMGMYKRTDRDTKIPGSIRITPTAINHDGHGLGRQGRSIIEKPTAPLSPAISIAFKVCRITEFASWMTAGLCAFAFAIVALTPILVPILSFGSIFLEGWRAWLDFATTAWNMSINPALISATAGALALALKKGKIAMENRLHADDDKGIELRRLEALIKS